MDIILLHGALGSSEQFDALKSLFPKHFKLHSFSFSGHGDREIPTVGYSANLFLSDIEEYMASNGIDRASFVGYSLGGYVAMEFAKRFPEKVNKIITIATKYNWDVAIAANEVKALDPVKMEAKVPSFVEALKQIHGASKWSAVVSQTATFLTELGNHDYLNGTELANIHCPTLLVLGDRDKMVSFAETTDAFKALPNAQVCIIPNCGHGIDNYNSPLLEQLFHQFL